MYCLGVEILPNVTLCAFVFSDPVCRRLQVQCVFWRHPGPVGFRSTQSSAKLAENWRRKEDVQCYDVSHQTFKITLPVEISWDFPEFVFQAAGSKRHCIVRKLCFPPFWAVSCCEWKKDPCSKWSNNCSFFSFCVQPACWDVSKGPDKTKQNNSKQAQQTELPMYRVSTGTFACKTCVCKVETFCSMESLHWKSWNI